LEDEAYSYGVQKVFFSCLTIFAKVFCLVLMFYLFSGCLVVLCCFYLFLVLMVIWFIMPQDLLCQMSIFFYEIIHFYMSKMCLCFFIFHAKNTLTRAYLTLSGILKVPTIHKLTTLRIIGETLII
jgi:hypothetical protein